MSDAAFEIPVIVELETDVDRAVGSAKEALDLLSGEWPANKTGHAYAEAVKASRAALEGRLAVEEARGAFSAAAWEAGVFVSDLRRLSEVA